MKKLYALGLAILASASMNMNEQDASGETKTKFEIKPTGRILLDGAVIISPQSEKFKRVEAIPDVRLGVNMKYGKADR